MDRQVIKEFEKAWAESSAGTSNQEGVVLIFRMFDGSYRAQAAQVRAAAKAGMVPRAVNLAALRAAEAQAVRAVDR